MTDNKAKNTVTAIILRDYWDDDGERHCAGSEVEVPKDALIEGMEAGILARKKEA